MHFNVFDRPVYLLASSNKWRRIIWQAIVEKAPAAVMARLDIPWWSTTRTAEWSATSSPADAYESERVGAVQLIDSASPGQAWIGDRHFCTAALLGGLDARGAGFIVREHAKHPHLQQQGARSTPRSIETGQVREQSIDLVLDEGESSSRVSWRRIEIDLTAPPIRVTKASPCGAAYRQISRRRPLPSSTENVGASKGCSGVWSRCSTVR